MIVSEVFGPTVQGEGPSCGRIATFVRLGRCDLRCSWCDTPYTWDWHGHNGVRYDPAQELERLDVLSVVARVEAINTHLVVCDALPLKTERQYGSHTGLMGTWP